MGVRQVGFSLLKPPSLKFPSCCDVTARLRGQPQIWVRQGSHVLNRQQHLHIPSHTLP